jgi:hypothetical protein
LSYSKEIIILEKEIFIESNDNYILEKDYFFQGLTLAALLMGRYAKGLTEWRFKNGMSLK